MDKEKLDKFIHLLKIVHTMPPLTGKSDLGLIVKEPESKISSDEVLEEIKKIVAIEKISYNESISDEETIERIIEVLKENKWIFLEIKKDIKSPLLNQLRYLADHNILQLIDYKDQDLTEIKIGDSRIIIFAERDFIENKITYPYFYRLFGPTLSL